MINSKKIGLGIDIVNNDRFKNLNLKSDSDLLKKMFLKDELDYCFSKIDAAPCLAVRFACKEAVVKALNSIGKFSINYDDISILKDTNNVPYVKINDSKIQNIQVNVSLSHCEDKSIAVAIALENE